MAEADRCATDPFPNWSMGGITFGDINQQQGAGSTGSTGRSGGPRESVDPGPPPLNRVLMLMSNPDGTDALLLDEEQRSIEAALTAGRYRDRLALVTSAATRYYDLQPALRRHNPVALHFSGHGSGTGGIVLSDRNRYPVAVPADALATTFGLLGEAVRCVVLNACFTWPQAEAIGRYVPCVVGTSRKIADSLAIEFASGFYAAAADGHSVGVAFELGRNRVDLGGSSGSDAMMLIDRPEGAAYRLYLHA